MTKVVINICYGGWSLSPEAIREYLARQGKEVFFYSADFSTAAAKGGGFKEVVYTQVEDPKEGFMLYSFTKDLGPEFSGDNTEAWNEHFYDRDLTRDDPVLVSVVEDLGSERASGALAQLKVVEVPDDVSWEIQEYDGTEWVAESHRTWA